MHTHAHKATCPLIIEISRAKSFASSDVSQPVVRFHSISCVFEMNQHGLYLQQSFYVERHSAFLKRQKVEMIPSLLRRPTPFVHAQSH